jgi:hypothetical protein
MMKYLKILFLGMVVIGLMALPAMAVDLRNVSEGSFPTGSGTGNAYKIAYEAYSNAAGVSTIADDAFHKGAIHVNLTSTLLKGDNVDLKVQNAKFVSAGPNFKFGLCLPTGSPLICDAGGIVGVLNLSGVTTDDLGFQITKPVVITYPSTTTLWVVQWDDSLGVVTTDIDTALEVNSVKNGVGLSVSAGLAGSCPPPNSFVKITFTTPHESTQIAQNFAYITPQFYGCGTPKADSISAELDTDTDFTTFVLGSGSTASFLRPHFIKVGNDGNSFFGICDGTTDANSNMWIAFVQGTVPTGTITFDVISAVPEPYATIEYNEYGCTTSDNKTFHCNSGSVSLLGLYYLEVELESGGSLDPTGWNLSNVNIGGNLCVFPSDQNLGVWYGGLEAFVPFVKGTVDRSYQTYIKLFNRYDKDAKVFVSTFADVPGGSAQKVMVSTAQLGISASTGQDLSYIPAGGMILITDQDIGTFVPGYDMSQGLPVKFNIRVPAQTGITTSSGNWTFGPSPNTSATLTHQNPYDPYVEGLVISIYPGSGQREIPLKFKHFKNGEYNQ